MRTLPFIPPHRAQVRVYVERLLVLPDHRIPGSFFARLDSGAEILTRSRQPLVDGARALLEAGFDPATPLTMRHAGKTYDSFTPAPIGELVRWSYTEGETTPLRRQAWKPREVSIAAVTEAQKSTSAVGPGETAEDAAQRRLAGGRP